MSDQSKAKRILGAFKRGDEMTAKQIEATYKVSSGRGVIQSLRKQGYAIFMNKRTNQRGVTRNFYRLGTPTRKMVAAGFAALGNDAFRMASQLTWNKVLVSVGGFPHKHIYKYVNSEYHLSPMSDGTFTVYRLGEQTPLCRVSLEQAKKEYYVEDKKGDTDTVQVDLQS